MSKYSLPKLLSTIAKVLSEVSEQPYLEAQTILGHVTQKSPATLMSLPSLTLNQDSKTKLTQVLSRRVASEPLAYILGSIEFYGVSIDISPGVLIPRPETEHLVDLCLQTVQSIDSDITILEVGSGTGAIAKGLFSKLANSLHRVSYFSLDSSAAASVSSFHNLANSATKSAPSAFSILNAELPELNHFYPNLSPDILVANPPYLTNDMYMHLDKSVHTFEPKLALLGGQDGLNVYRQIVTYLKTLRSMPYLFLELDAQIANSVQELFTPFYAQVELTRDLFGEIRYLEAAPKSK